LLYNEEKSLQSSLYFKTKNILISAKKSEGNLKIQKIKVEKMDTYAQTLKLLEEKLSLSEIALNRDMTLQTIQDHIIKLYNFNKITLSEILKYSSLEKLKMVREVIKKENFTVDKLKPIKDMLSKEVNYFDIKIALAMIEK